MWCTCLYTDTHSALQNTHPVIPAWRGNERVVWSASYSCYYCSQWKNVSLWAQEAIKFSTENEKECEWVKISEKREEEDRWRERKEWHNVCQMRKGGEMKSVIRFHGGTSPTFKEPFRSSCTSVFLFKASSSSNKQQTLSERRSLLQQQPEVFGFVFFGGGFSHDQSFWIQWTWNKSIQVSATVRKSMSGYVQWTNLMLVSGCSVCLNQCVPAGFSVTCCISLAFRTSIRHDKVTPSSGINTGAHFHLHTKGLKSSMQSSVVWFS